MGSPERLPLEQQQLEVERCLRDIQPDIEFADLQLEQAYYQGYEQEQLKELGDSLVEQLDDEWSFIDEEFLVIGKWRVPKFSRNDDSNEEGATSFSVSISDTEVLERARSKGFIVDYNQQVPRVSLLFERRNDKNPQISISGYGSLYGHLFGQAFPNDVALEYVGHSAQNITDIKDSMSVLSEELELGERLHQLYIAQPNFYRLSPKRQQAIMSGLVERVNRLIASSDSVVVEVDAGGVLVSREDGVNLSIVRHDDDFLKLRGQLAGVDLLNRNILNEGVTSPDQLKSPDAGLYIDLVDLQEPTPDVVIERKVAHVVLRTIENMRVVEIIPRD